MLTLFDYLWFDCLWLPKRGIFLIFFFRKLYVKIIVSLFFPLAVDRTFFFHKLSARRALITAFDINYATGKSCSVLPYSLICQVYLVSHSKQHFIASRFWMCFWFGNFKYSIHCKYCPCLFNILHSLIQVCLELAHNKTH